MTTDEQLVLHNLKNNKIWDADYMMKIHKNRWPDATGYMWSVKKESNFTRVSLFAHTPDGKWAFCSKRLGDRTPVEFSNNKK